MCAPRPYPRRASPFREGLVEAEPVHSRGCPEHFALRGPGSLADFTGGDGFGYNEIANRGGRPVAKPLDRREIASLKTRRGDFDFQTLLLFRSRQKPPPSSRAIIVCLRAQLRRIVHRDNKMTGADRDYDLGAVPGDAVSSRADVLRAKI
jgi:hypothetical protein